MLRESSDDIAPEEMPLHILYEDEALLILNKPPGIVVHPTHGHYTGTLANGVVHYWRGKGEKVRFRPIHRLDEDTSGIVVIAKNAYVHQQLSEQMQAGKMDKNYVAYVYGQVDKAEQLIDAPIDRDPAQPHMRTVIQTGYASQTIVKAVKYYRYVHKDTNEVTNATLVQLKLLTGRTHQIRVHTHYIGHPLIGDQMYKAPDKYMLELPMSRQALHANKLTFIHPMTRVRMTIEAPFPEDFKQLESRLQEEFL